jgi:PKD repeat protein
MASIVKWHYDFGDGESSSSRNPFHVYKNPGYYTVTQTVTDSYGIVSTKSKTSYVRVYSYADAIYDFGENATCLVYGFNSGNGAGWAEFSGDEWLFPESKEALVRLNIGDDNHNIVFDFNTGLPFILNTFGEGVYRDKVGHPDEPDGFPISSKILTPEMIGSDRRFRIKHDETFFDLRPNNGYEFSSDFEIDMSLVADGETRATETIRNVDSSREVLFTNKELADRVQVLIDLSESGYKISGIETSCVVSDTSRYASDVHTTDIEFQTYMSMSTQWFTRPRQWVNRSTGLVGIPQSSMIDSEGADRYASSGFQITTDSILDVSTDSVMMLWYLTNNPPTITDTNTTNPLDLTGESFDVWTFSVVDIISNASITLGVGSKLFDVRIFDSVLGDADNLSGYTQDVLLNFGQKFLPGYAE